MKRPSFQFYPADWKNNSKLRRCSEAARGAWVDILCLLHDSDEYGICRWPLSELARAAGVPLKLVKELVDKDVLKGAEKMAAPYIYTPRHAGKDGEPVTLVEARDGPCWYCSRFVRDEWVRQRRGQGSRFTADNQPTKGDDKSEPKPTPKGDIGGRQGDGPTSTSTLRTTTPNPVDTGPPERPVRDRGIALKTFLQECAAKGERPIRDYAPLWNYIEGIGLPGDFVALSWAEFCRRFMPDGAQHTKRQKDWRSTFRKYVENNYFGLWAIGQDGNYFLTTKGKQAEKFQESKATA